MYDMKHQYVDVRLVGCIFLVVVLFGVFCGFFFEKQMREICIILPVVMES